MAGTTGGSKPLCIARLKRPWLPPAAMWLFPPHNDSHTIGGWCAMCCSPSRVCFRASPCVLHTFDEGHTDVWQVQPLHGLTTWLLTRRRARHTLMRLCL